MKCKNVSIILLIFILTIVFCISCNILLKDFKEYKESDKSTEKLIEETIEIKEETQERSIDWEYLKSINKDIIAWIEIENTQIDYPILKDKDVYYLKHTFDNKYNSQGSIFTTNSYPFEDKETIVYGHNMKNGSMFSDLGKYLNKDFLNSHFNFKIYTPTCNYEARIFSVYSIGVETESNNIKSLNFEDRIEYYKKASEYNIETDSNIKKIVKLSTCSYLNATTTPTDQRYYIVANLIQL